MITSATAPPLFLPLSTCSTAGRSAQHAAPQRYRHQEFIRFLNAIEAEVPAGKLVHVILDKYAAHKHRKVIRLARPPSALHLSLTSCSWLNAAETFFATLTKRRLKRHPRGIR
jgi:hypothetical protein